MGNSGLHSSTRKQQKVAALTKRERAFNHRILRILIAVIAATLLFGLGFLVRSQTDVIAGLGFPIDGSPFINNTSQKSTYDSPAARVDVVENILSENSLDSIDVSKATESMLTDLMTSTGDPCAAYFTPDRYKSFISASTQGSYAGVGVLFSDYDGRAYVADVYEGSEAEAKGVQQGDYVEAIDGDTSHDWTVTEVVNALKRDDGESVVITWMRPTSLSAKTGETFTTTLVCRVYEAVNVESELVDQVGYIQLRQLTQNASNLVRDAAKSLMDEGAQALVLDVRDNPGGYLTQAVDVASLFVQSGVIVEVQTIDGITSRNATGQVLSTDVPLVIMANGYTAAAAEVLVAALQDNQRATFVGQTTMGKGSVQVVRELSFGGAVRYTAAYYLSPLGHQINGLGVAPDVSISESGDQGVDAQYTVAMDVARSLIPA